jgi:hypothetical protein
MMIPQAGVLMSERFGLDASEIKPLVVGRGSCLASNRITFDSQRVGFMYREAPDHADDSGWRFFAGDETQEYADEPKNFKIYNVNTIANYDPDIIAYLDAPPRSAFERRRGQTRFVDVAFPG